MKVCIGLKQVVSNCLSRLLHVILSCAPAIIPTIFFDVVKIFPQLKGLPTNIITYFKQSKIMRLDWFVGVTVIDVDRRPNDIKCSTSERNHSLNMVLLV
jgi:hypothetical protein